MYVNIRSNKMRAAAAVLTFVLLSIQFGHVSGGQTTASFGDDVEEILVDVDQDGLAENLRLRLEVMVYVPGAYGVYGKITGSGSVASLEPSPMGLGNHLIELDFPGSDLTTFDWEGYYDISLELYSTDSTVESVHLDLTTTEMYSPDMFESQEGGAFTTVSVVENDIVIVSREMEIMVNMTLPRLTYSYSGPASSGSKGSIEYREVLAFDDTDGDGRWDPSVDEKRLEADLEDVDWNLMTDFSSGYDIALYGIVPMKVVGTATATSYMRMTFTFHSDALSPEGDSQKFNIEMELIQPLEADNIAVMHSLRDLSGDQNIGEGGYGDDPFALTLKKKDKVQTIYSWTDEIEVGTEQIDNFSFARTWYYLREDGADIYFSYPLVNNTLLIFHDPIIGIDPENRPKTEEREDFLRDNPAILLGGLLIGALIVGTTLYSKVKGSRRRMGGGG